MKILVIDDMKFPDDLAEAYVENCDHCDDETIHIARNPKHYKRIFKKHGEIVVMTSILSHEHIHNVILKIAGNKESRTMDNLFGYGTQYKEEYHGLCRLKYRLRNSNKLNRVKRNKKRGL